LACSASAASSSTSPASACCPAGSPSRPTRPCTAAPAFAPSRPSPRCCPSRRSYAGNLLGALLGTLLTAYAIVPYLGLWGAAAFACGCNLAIAIFAWRCRSAMPSAALPLPSAAGPSRSTSRSAELSAAASLVLSFLSGLVLFALEILWTHLLSAVIGSSVYAFSTMLAAVLAALYWAARTESSSKPRVPLPALVFRGAVLLAITIPLIPLSTFVFSLVGLPRPGFAVRELTRLVVAFGLIVPVGVAISQIFPRLLEDGVVAGAESRQIGRLTAANTVGCLGGLLVTRFVLIPSFGSAPAAACCSSGCRCTTCA
jgi:hypothetical protein